MIAPSTLAFISGEGVPYAAAIFIALLIGHVLADYPLQGGFLATAKNRHHDASVLFSGESPPRGLWVHALTAHSLVHAAAVWLITGSLALGLIEWVLHWLIDYAKCERWLNFNTDQALHILCKAAYVAAIMLGWV